MLPVTYYPVDTQQQFATNAVIVHGKPYARYFNGDLWLHDDALPAITACMPVSAALPPTPVGLNRLLEPGYHEVENGYCALPDGTAYVASRVAFPHCTGDMFAWWMWWYSVEPARYTLWYPYNHVYADPVDRAVLTQPGLTHEERYIGNTHRVVEYIGPERVDIAIHFIDPAELGFDTARFAAAGIVAHACARVSLRRPHRPMATMVHLARRIDDGFELRSRYWIGHDMAFTVADRHIGVDRLLAASGYKHRHFGARVAYEQLLHDQIEFTHLSTFLADIYHDYAN